MQRLLSIFIILLISFGLMINDANAKRFGGGRSFGMQRTATSPFSRTQNSNASPLNPQKNRWLGPLAGLAAGGLLASLFMGHGIGSGIFSWILMAGVAYVVWTFIRNRMQLALQTRQNNNYNNNIHDLPHSSFNNTFSQANNTNYSIPNFDENTFLRDAKVQFIRLQAAYDNKNINDIREFSTPEVYAEIQLQLNERGNETNYTEVVSINAELLDTANESQAVVASVRFSGMIKEDLNSPAAPFNEIWHFRKTPAQSEWMVSGIQQSN